MDTLFKTFVNGYLNSFEKVILNRLIQHYNEYLAKEQFGFRQNSYTEKAIF
jgi:hypothetical protein